MPKIIDVTGQRFGKLVVIKKDTSRTKNHENYWVCKCDCGEINSIRIGHLRSGDTWRCHQCKCVSMRNDKLSGEISTQFWKRLLSNAKIRGCEVLFAPDEAWRVFNEQQGCCAYSGVKLEFSESSSHSVRNLTTASIDRIDSSKPYVLDNVHWVHKIVNKMKMELSQSEFLDWCKKITEAN